MTSNVEEYQNLVSILKQALEFYANKENYEVNVPQNNVLFAYIEMDKGAQARFALEKIVQMENNHKELESEFTKLMGLGITEEESAKTVQNMIEEFKKLTENGDKV
jgi:iron-sulfur cluster repair protein YtfE (RIC family)